MLENLGLEANVFYIVSSKVPVSMYCEHTLIKKRDEVIFAFVNVFLEKKSGSDIYLHRFTAGFMSFGVSMPCAS